MRKRFLATLLALAMVLSVTPFALADNGGEDNGVTSQAAKELPDAENGVITLTEDVTLSTAYEVTEGNVIIDLAGYTLAYDGTGKVFLDVQGGSLTIRDSGGKGEVKVNEPYDGTGTDGKTQWIKCVQVHAGATFTLEGGTLTNTNTAFEATQVISNYGTTYIKGGTVKGVTGIFIYNPVRGNDEWINYVSTCNVSGGSIVGVAPTTYQGSNQYGNSSVADLNWSYGIAIYGPGMDSNGAVDNNKSVLNIRGGTITAGQAIGTNASSGRYAGYTINMSGGTVDGGTGTGMYLPAIGETNISGGTVKGAQAIRIAAGELNITDGTIIGTSLMSENTDLISGGSGGTEGAIVVGKASSGYVGDVDITISNGAIITNTAEGNGDAIRPAIVVSDKNMGDESKGYDDLSISVNVDGATIDGDVVKVSNLSSTNTEDGGNTSLVIENATVTGNVSNQSKTGLTVKDSTITGNVTNTSEGSTALLNTTVQGEVKDEEEGAGSIFNDQEIGETVALNQSTSKSYTDLATALSEAEDGQTIVLLADITDKNVGKAEDDSIGEMTLLNVTKSVTINGNGNSITLTVPDDKDSNRNQVINVGKQGENGKVTLTLDDVNLTITGRESNDKYVGDAFNLWGGAKLVIQNSKLDLDNLSSAFTVQVVGADIKVDNSTITSETIGGNFSQGGYWTVENGSSITVTNCKNHGLSVSSLTLTGNSAVSVTNAGYRGISINDTDGKLDIQDGSTVTVTDCATEYNGTAVVLGDSATGGLQVAEGATLKVTGTNDKITLNGSDNNALAGTVIGTMQDKNNAPIVAVIEGGDGYTSLTAAIEAAQNGETVKLLQNVDISGGEGNTTGILTITENITLDGDNHTIKAVEAVTKDSSMINIQGGANVTIKDLTIDSNDLAKHGLNINSAQNENTTVTVSNVTIKNGTGYGVVCNSSTLTADGLNTEGNAWGGVNVDAKVEGKGSTFTMNSGTIGEKASVVIENAEEEEITATITGGTFQNVVLQNVENNVDLTITGGNFNDVKEVTKDDTGITEKAPSDMITITGGTFKEDVSDYLADGLIQNDDGTVGKPPYIPPNPSYLVSVNQAQGGKVTANPTAAKKGDTVTLTVSPEDGYELAELTVTDFWGKDVALTANGDGTYSFTMPSSQVEVKASFTQAEKPELPFTDVTEADWFYDEVYYVWANGLMIGDSDTTFGPNGTTTRAMVWTILARMDGETITGSTWVEDARAWAMENEVSDGTDADRAVTREELVTMIWRYVGEPQGTGDLSGFADADTVSGWAQEAMRWSVGAGLIQGDENGLTPTATAIRAQIAAILMRFCENVAK